MQDIETEFVHLARLALEGRTADVAMILRRALPKIIQRRPDLSDDAKRLLVRAASPPTRDFSGESIPVDSDTRLQLLRTDPVPEVVIDPVWPVNVEDQLRAVLNERDKASALAAAGIPPTRSMLFTGPPGVGKTLAARWIASKLGRPLLTLDLAAVMSSFLGRTGNNIRVVLDFAQRAPSVLLLDEFDAIAKRRDDVAEVGELKRLVTVLVQTIDDWPAHGLLIAATNHAELLDPAVWRRFDRIVTFPLPTRDEISRCIASLIGQQANGGFSSTIETLASLLEGRSFSEVARYVSASQREAVVNGIELQTALLSMSKTVARGASLAARLHIASHLQQKGQSQRAISEATGLSRDTIRKHLNFADAAGRRSE
jgi:SpoVK/Ycf46/Vps4 family AAA+-type ATPase